MGENVSLRKVMQLLNRTEHPTWKEREETRGRKGEIEHSVLDQQEEWGQSEEGSDQPSPREGEVQRRASTAKWKCSLQSPEF